MGSFSVLSRVSSQVFRTSLCPASSECSAAASLREPVPPRAKHGLMFRSQPGWRSRVLLSPTSELRAALPLATYRHSRVSIVQEQHASIVNDPGECC